MRLKASQLFDLLRANTHSLIDDDVEFQIKLPDENRFVQLGIKNYRHYGAEKRLVIDLEVKDG